MNSVQWITLSPHWCGSFTSCWPFVCKKVKIPRRRRRSRFCQFHVDVFQPLPSFPTRLLSHCSRSTVLAVVTDKILTAPLQKHVLFAEVTVCEIFSFRTKTKNMNKCRKWGNKDSEEKEVDLCDLCHLTYANRHLTNWHFAEFDAKLSTFFMHLKDVTAEICAQSLLKYPEVFLLIKSLFCTFLNFNFLARLVGRLPAACLL